MKKLLTMLLALVMVFSLSVTAFAAEEDTATGKTITITGATGHTYNVYQIFTGDVVKEGDSLVLSNVKYGENVLNKGHDVGEDLLTSYMAMDGDALAKILQDQIPKDATPIAILNGDNDWTAKGLATGYYLIEDVTPDNVLVGETRSPLILQVVEDVSIASKHAGLVFEKKVKDTNDSTNVTSGWQDTADYDIGDAVPFKLSATLPSTYKNYTSYELTFHDYQEVTIDGTDVRPSFGPPQNVNVYIEDNDDSKENIVLKNDQDYFVNTTGNCSDSTCTFNTDSSTETRCSFTVNIPDLKNVLKDEDFAKDYKVVVEYTAELLTTANIGIAGNENHAYVSHPDGKTPTDYVIVFTYKLLGNKVDGEGKPLNGAKFELYKFLNDETGTDTYYKDNKAYTGTWKQIGLEVAPKAVEDTSGNVTAYEFGWEGLDDGIYKLVESQTPDGYNTMADHVIVIDAVHHEIWDETTGFPFENLVTDGSWFNDTVVEGGVAVHPKDGVLFGEVVNNKGTVLPETGAEGTAMFIGLGSLLTLVAVVFLVTRKKMSVYEN